MRSNIKISTDYVLNPGVKISQRLDGKLYILAKNSNDDIFVSVLSKKDIDRGNLLQFVNEINFTSYIKAYKLLNYN